MRTLPSLPVALFSEKRATGREGSDQVPWSMVSKAVETAKIKLL